MTTSSSKKLNDDWLYLTDTRGCPCPMSNERSSHAEECVLWTPRRCGVAPVDVLERGHVVQPLAYSDLSVDVKVLFIHPYGPHLRCVGAKASKPYVCQRRSKDYLQRSLASTATRGSPDERRSGQSQI
jgi:hypothetical protein